MDTHPQDALATRAALSSPKVIDWEATVRQHEKALLRHARRYSRWVRGDRAAFCEDAVQETFARAFLNRDRYKPQYKLSTWLFTIETRLLQNAFRKERRVVSLESLDEADLSDDDFMDQVEKDLEIAAGIRSVISTLSEREYRVLYMIASGASSAEVAFGLGFPNAHAVDSAATKARNKVRKNHVRH